MDQTSPNHNFDDTNHINLEESKNNCNRFDFRILSYDNSSISIHLNTNEEFNNPDNINNKVKLFAWDDSSKPVFWDTKQIMNNWSAADLRLKIIKILKNLNDDQESSIKIRK